MIKNILNKSFIKDKLNILCVPIHERYESNLCKTGHEFWAWRGQQVKDWNTDFAPIPSNYHLLNPTLKEKQIPPHVNIDVIISGNKFGCFQMMSQYKNHLKVPLISVEHTAPHPNWNKQQLDSLKSMKGDVNIFISEWSRKQWGWGEEAIVIHHGIDTDTFRPLNLDRNDNILTTVNEYSKRNWCKLEGQKILTENGYVPIEKIKIGDRVLTDSGEIHYVYNTISRNYNGDIIKIFVDNIKNPICFTPEHHIRVFRDNQWLYVESNRVRKGDVLRFPKIKTTRFECNDKGLSWLIGTIIGDGSITNKGNISICFNENEKYRMNKCYNILNSIVGYCKISDIHRAKGKKIYTIECHSKIFGNWLKNLIGNYSKLKSIPDFIFYGSDEIRLECLQGLWGCDGSFKNGNHGSRFVYSTTSVKLSSQVSSLLQHFGIQVFISKEKRTTNKSNGKEVSIYRVRSSSKENVDKCLSLINDGIFQKDSYSYKITNIQVEEYNGKVYNCSVETDPSYVCYPGFVAHNCCGYNLYKEVTNGLSAVNIGNDPPYSLPAKSTEDLVIEHNKCCVFLNTSTHSPFPMSVFEAMACGDIVVSLPTCMIPEVIKHGENGILVDNAKDMRNILLDIIRNRHKYEYLGLNARKTILERFTLDKFLNKWNEVFDGLSY